MSDDRVEINAAAIPDELAERDQWLFWNARSDRPRMPLADPDATRGCAWSDPETWTDFETATAAAADVDQAGIGYVNAAANDDFARGLYATIDLDGCVGEDGRPKDWLPSLQPFFDHDAFMEYSPSGQGIHIPVVGLDVPDWWADQHFSDDEHEGVEVLANKFSTVTGDALRGCGGDVVEAGDWLVDWLAEAYQVLTGEDPLAAESAAENAPTTSGAHETGDRDEWLDEDIAREALDHINPDCSYSTWMNIGMALANHFGETAGQRLFENWSRGGSKWDRDAERQAERIINDASNYDFGIGTVVKHASGAGWDASAAAREHGSGGASARSDGESDDSDEDGGEEAGPWEQIYKAYCAAEDADERLPARFEATNQLSTESHWRTLIENDKLWRYDPDLGIYKPDGEARARERLVETLQEQYKANELREICEQLRGRTMTREEQFGGPECHIATENCVLEIGSDSIDAHDHSPEYEFVGRCQTPYDPDADCPRFRAFLEESVEGGQQIKTLQEYAGYALMHWKLPFHKALFLVGPTASGKSTFLDTIRAMLGEHSVASLTPQQMTSERFGGAELYGKWANIRNDIPASVIEDTGQFKEITAGDPIKAEEKYQDPFMFEPTAKHMFSANQLPDADTDDEAFFRRILLIAFPTTVPRGERDPKLDDKLQHELPGILNWCLDGLQRLMKQGRFTMDRTPGQTQDTWEKWGNSVDRFAKLCLEEDSGSKLPKSDVYSAYVSFCEAEGIPTETQHALTRELKLQGYEDGRMYADGDRQRVFEGMTFTSRGEEYLEGDSSDDGGGATGGGGGLDSY